MEEIVDRFRQGTAIGRRFAVLLEPEFQHFEARQTGFLSPSSAFLAACPVHLGFNGVQFADSAQRFGGQKLDHMLATAAGLVVDIDDLRVAAQGVATINPEIHPFGLAATGIELRYRRLVAVQHAALAQEFA